MTTTTLDQPTLEAPVKKVASSLLQVTATNNSAGVKFTLKSKILHDFFKGQFEALEEYDRNFIHSSACGNLSDIDANFRKIPALNYYYGRSLIGDPSRCAYLLTCDKLEEGFSFQVNGMVPRDVVDQIMTTLKNQAAYMYKSFITPYTVTLNLSINEES